VWTIICVHPLLGSDEDGPESWQLISAIHNEGMVNAIQAAKSLYTCPPHSQCESISDLNWRLTKDLKKVKFEVHHLMP
jgi:hypothetical protein